MKKEDIIEVSSYSETSSDDDDIPYDVDEKSPKQSLSDMEHYTSFEEYFKSHGVSTRSDLCVCPICYIRCVEIQTKRKIKTLNELYSYDPLEILDDREAPLFCFVNEINFENHVGHMHGGISIAKKIFHKQWKLRIADGLTQKYLPSFMKEKNIDHSVGMGIHKKYWSADNFKRLNVFVRIFNVAVSQNDYRQPNKYHDNQSSDIAKRLLSLL